MQRGASFALLFWVLAETAFSQITVTGSNGSDGSYTSLTRSGGAFSAVNSRNQAGRNIVVTVTANSTSENGAVALTAGNWTSLVIFPNGSGRTISGSANAPLIQLNGADRVTIDGRVNRTGSVASLTINNTNTRSGAETIRFINSAENNSVTWCIIRGSGSGGTRGIITFSTASSGNGNDNNLISGNNITGNGTSRPRNAIYSSGTAGFENSGNIISNNNIYDVTNRGLASNGIYLLTASTQWTITGNSIYETASLAPTASVNWYSIRINNTSGSSFSVSGNYIGGNAPMCAGTALTKTAAANNVFYGIYLNVATSAASSVNGNIIRNINWSNSLNANFTAIQVAGGSVNIGTVSGNSIGANTGTGSVRLTNGSTGGFFYGIRVTGSGDVVVSNNIVGSVTTSNTAANATSAWLISKSGTAGIFTVSNNQLGSISSTASVNTSSASTGNAQALAAVYSQGTGTVTITGNTVANLVNSTTNTNTATQGYVTGIWSSAGTNTISGNTINSLRSSSANNQSGTSASVTGILLSGATRKDVISNVISNLSNTYASFSGSINGVFYTGSTSGNTVSGNFVYGLTVQASAAATITGIRFSSGSVTAYNNIVELSGTGIASLYGVWEAGLSGNNTTFIFNTVWTGGSSSSLSSKSYALFSNASANTRDIRNNILVNIRTTPGGSSLHYAIWLNYATSTGLTLNYNNYYVSGTGGILGWYGGGNRTVLPVVTGNDLKSLAADPLFTSQGTSVATGYRIGQPLIGTNAGGVTSDFGASVRLNPSMGAWEAAVNKWTGSVNSTYSNGSNWTVNVPLGSDPDIVFSDTPANNCLLDSDLSVTNITVTLPLKNISANGYKLTLKGSLIMTGGGAADLSTPGSTLSLAGTTTQTLNGASLYNNTVYNLEINNPANIILTGALNIINNIVSISGRLDALTGSPTITMTGSGPQSLNENTILNNNIFNLASSNSSGLTINSGFTIANNLSVNAGGKVIIADPHLVTVTGNISNNSGTGGLVLKSTVQGSDAKLINNTSPVPATVELQLNGGDGSLGPAYHYFVPPVSSMAIDNTSVEATASSLGLSSFGGDLLSYDETKATTGREAGWQYFDGYNNTTPFNSLSSSRGYNIYLEAEDKITFAGNLNYADKTFTITFSEAFPYPGWNLIGNPFPCNFDLNGVGKLKGSDDGIDNTVYFTSDVGYAYWNVVTGGTTGYSDIVGPMQGFFVRARENTTVTFPAASKTSLSALPLRAKGTADSRGELSSALKKVKLSIRMNDKYDETIVCLIGNATNGFDGDYDAWKFQNSGAGIPSFFSCAGSEKYAINAVKGPVPGEEVTVPLAVTVKSAGTYTIATPEFENLTDTKVTLVHGTTETVLTGDKSYTFTTEAGTFTDFSLKFGQKETVGIEEEPEEKHNIWYSDGFLYIKLPSDGLAKANRLSVYDLNGRISFEKSDIHVGAGELHSILLSVRNGVYIVKMTVNGKVYTSKILVF